MTKARRLAENVGIAFMGGIQVGRFTLTPDEAAAMLVAHNPDGRANHDVIRPWRNGLDITRRSRDLRVIDFGVDMPQEQAALYEGPFEYVRRVVLPFRQTVRQECCRRRWWIHHNARPEMRKALAGVERYVATPRVAKYRLFAWLDVAVLPDNQLIVIARDDDYTFGVLHSRVHEQWALAMGTQLETRPRYTPTTTFETFPFPRSTPEQRDEIAAAAKRLDELRRGWLDPVGASDDDLKVRTLTNLYNEMPTWLRDCHDRLDRAVLAAYGWPVEITDDDLLARLLELNLKRASDSTDHS